MEEGDWEPDAIERGDKYESIYRDGNICFDIFNPNDLGYILFALAECKRARFDILEFLFLILKFPGSLRTPTGF